MGIVENRIMHWKNLKKVLRHDHVVLMEVLEKYNIHTLGMGRRLFQELMRVMDGTHELMISTVLEQLREKNNHKEELIDAVRDILWMARRYADGRRTYAPDMFNMAQKKLVDMLGEDILRTDPIIEDYPYATDPDVPVREKSKLWKVKENEKIVGTKRSN